MGGVIEFGFDEGKIVRAQGAELFKQSRSGDRSRLSVVAFKRYHDLAIAKKTKEAGRPLSDQGKAEIVARVDTKLAEQLKKEVKDLTEVDRLEIREPRFKVANTHFNEAVGTIRCLSDWEGNTMVRKDLCCEKFGEPDQSVATVIMTYPVDKDLQIEVDILKARKMTNFYIWKLGSKKFNKLASTYVDARGAGIPVVDLKVTLDGDPKYQKQVIETTQGPAYWARTDTDPAVRAWVLDQGLRLWKYVENHLGFEMKKETLVERLQGAQQSTAALSGGEASASAPKAIGSYDDLLT